ncbi:RHS repeat-associated core domain-containing protein [Pseudomonas capeferrum]|uniref:RHS repeat-associated core domain-containing protein n=1 Tax=Pseudomonas capeferrum TaxID=1495066 RepID=UPI003978B301
MFNSLSNSLFMYRGGKLVTVKQGKHHRTIFRSAEIPLAEQQTGGTPGIGLLATDDKGSVLKVQAEADVENHYYSAYGDASTLPSALTLLGFNSEHLEANHRCQMLGNGYRAYSPQLMRFHSPDSWAPFNQGGINGYAYCSGDPVNRFDPSGHFFLHIRPAQHPILKPSKPNLLKPRRLPIVRSVKIDHYESLTRTTLRPGGKGENMVTTAETSTRRTLRTTEVFEVLSDPQRSSATVHVTRTSLDNYLAISNTLQNAQAANAMSAPHSTVSAAFLNNLENSRIGLTLVGEALFRRANNPRDLTAYPQGQFRISAGASEIRRTTR